jgi:hypothetical protein
VPTKRIMVKYNRSRAKECVYEDWMKTAIPIFDGICPLEVGHD